MFVDREEELSWLISLYNGRLRGAKYNVVVYGLRRVGKTTLLEEFIKRIDYGILLRVSYVTSGRELVDNLIGALSDLAIKKNLDVPKYDYPQSTFEALKFLIEYPQAYSEANNIVLAMCLDEFHLMIENLASRIALEERLKLRDALRKVFWYLKDSLPLATRVFWVLSTSLSWHLLEKYSKTDPARKAFLALFATRKIEPLDRKSSIELMKHLSIALGHEVPHEVAERIYEVTGGIPALIELVIGHVSPRKIKNVEELNRLLEELSNLAEFNDFFEAILRFIDEASRYGRNMILRVMRSIACGKITPSEIAKDEALDYNVVYNLLEELVEMEFVEKQKLNKEAIYLLKYPLMKTWLLSTKPYISTMDREKLRASLGIMFDKYIEGLFNKAKELNKPVVIEEKNGALFNNTTDRLEILPIYKVYTPKGPPQRQIDLIAIGRIGARELYYLIENKYTMSLIQPGDVEKFIERVRTLVHEEGIKNYVALIIQGGEGGYHPSSIAVAVRNNTITVTKIGLIKIAKKSDTQKSHSLRNTPTPRKSQNQMQTPC